MPRKLWFASLSYFHRTSCDAMLSMAKFELNLILDVLVFSKKAEEVVFLMFLKDTVKQNTNV